MTTRPVQILDLDPSFELVFKGPFSEVVTTKLTLKNPTNTHVGFKVLTTTPRQYCVRPNSGIIQPHDDACVSVMLQPMEEVSEKNWPKHKFRVQSLVVDYTTTADSLDAAIKRAPKSSLMDSFLRCTFVKGPPEKEAMQSVPLTLSENQLLKEITKKLSDENAQLKIEAVRRDVQTKDQQLQEKDQQIQQQNQQIQDKNQHIQEMEQRLQYFEQQLQEKDQQIQRMDQQIQRMDQQIQRKDQQIQEKDQHLQLAQQQMQEKDGSLRRSQNQIQQLHSNLSQLSTEPWEISREELTITQEILGSGAYGEVRVAIFRGLRVAAKFLHKIIASEYNLHLLSREMTIAAQVRHPNLLLFIGATTQGQPSIILTELMTTSLRAELDRGQISQEQIKSIAIDVSCGLHYLHMKKPEPIIHRDVSSPNVLMEPFGAGSWRAKVSDYGSANFVRQVTSTSVYPGNPCYAAPEADLPNKHSTKMDVYSFGVLLTEMSLHQPPKTTVTGRAEQAQMVQWHALADIIEGCMASSPDNRPTLGQVMEKLRRI